MSIVLIICGCFATAPNGLKRWTSLTTACGGCPQIIFLRWPKGATASNTISDTARRNIRFGFRSTFPRRWANPLCDKVFFRLLKLALTLPLQNPYNHGLSLALEERCTP